MWKLASKASAILQRDAQMPHYRLYMLDENSRIRHARDLDCPDDQAALGTIAEHHLQPPMELWSGRRLVGAYRTSDFTPAGNLDPSARVPAERPSHSE